MKELHCNVVQDLLPLYQEGEVSSETGRLIQAHLDECSQCAGELAGLRLPSLDEVHEQKADNKWILRRLRKTLMAVAGAVLVLMMILIGLSYQAGRQTVVEPQSVEPSLDGVFELLAGANGLPVDGAGEPEIRFGDSAEMIRQMLGSYAAPQTIIVNDLPLPYYHPLQSTILEERHLAILYGEKAEYTLVNADYGDVQMVYEFPWEKEAGLAAVFLVKEYPQNTVEPEGRTGLFYELEEMYGFARRRVPFTGTVWEDPETEYYWESDTTIVSYKTYTDNQLQTTAVVVGFMEPSYYEKRNQLGRDMEVVWVPETVDPIRDKMPAIIKDSLPLMIGAKGHYIFSPQDHGTDAWYFLISAGEKPSMVYALTAQHFTVQRNVIRVNLYEGKLADSVFDQPAPTKPYLLYRTELPLSEFTIFGLDDYPLLELPHIDRQTIYLGLEEDRAYFDFDGIPRSLHVPQNLMQVVNRLDQYTVIQLWSENSADGLTLQRLENTSGRNLPFNYDDMVVAGVALPGTMQEITNSLGRPQREEDVDDGYFEATPVIWHYPGLELTFYRLSTGFRVTTAKITGSRVTGPRGIRVGDTLAEILARFPDTGEQIKQSSPTWAFRTLYGDGSDGFNTSGYLHRNDDDSVRAVYVFSPGFSTDYEGWRIFLIIEFAEGKAVSIEMKYQMM